LYLGRRPSYRAAVISISGRAGESSNKMEVKVYVANLSKSTTQEQVKTLFTKAGTVSSVELSKDKDAGKPSGSAVISMSSQADADKAVSMFNDYFMGDGMLKVNIARPNA
jgi:RNA recognition motif-containing protein